MLTWLQGQARTGLLAGIMCSIHSDSLDDGCYLVGLRLHLRTAIPSIVSSLSTIGQGCLDLPAHHNPPPQLPSQASPPKDLKPDAWHERSRHRQSMKACEVPMLTALWHPLPSLIATREAEHLLPCS